MGKIKDIPLEERPREKGFLHGLDALTNGELLAIVISSGIKNHSSLDIAYEMLVKYGGVQGIVKAPYQELAKIKGVSKSTALKIQAGFYLYERALRETIDLRQIKGKENIAFYFRNILIKQNQESVYVIIVDKANHLITYQELFKGSKVEVIMSTKVILQYVMNNGSRFYLIHNHPSGDVSPSKNDRSSTGQLEIMAMQLGIEFIDHLIISKASYYSMKENQEYPFS